MTSVISYLAFFSFSLIIILRSREVINPFHDINQIIFWLWICDSHIVQTNKFQQYFQGDVLLTILNLSVFPNIVTTTIFHVHRCELTKCELSPPERLLIGATMINRWRCYNCWEIHVHSICITKLWDLSAYFHYLHGFLLTMFSSRTVQFSMLLCLSNLI